MNKLITTILRKILRIEHIIYCTSNCTIELPLHKSYYNHCRIKYEEHINKVLTPKYDW